MRTFRVQRGKPSKDSAVIPEGRTQWYDTQLPLQTEEYLTMELEGFVSAADPLPAFDYPRMAPQKGHCPPATNFREITLNRWSFIMQMHGSNGPPSSELVEKLSQWLEAQKVLLHSRGSDSIQKQQGSLRAHWLTSCSSLQRKRETRACSLQSS